LGFRGSAELRSELVLVAATGLSYSTLLRAAAAIDLILACTCPFVVGRLIGHVLIKSFADPRLVDNASAVSLSGVSSAGHQAHALSGIQ